MNFFDVKQSVNGDQIIGFTAAKEWELSKFVDAPRLSTYLMADDGKTHTKYLGLINMFATTESIAVPTLTNLFKNSAVLEVEPMQSITYDLPVNRDHIESVTTEDTSTKYNKPGIDQTVFEVVLSREYTKGDILGYDFYYGEQFKVVDYIEPEPHGNGFKHFVELVTKDRNKWFPNDKLKTGISYFKITNVLGEYDTNFSSINMAKGPSGTLKCEFILGDPRGVESFITAKAYNTKSQGFTQVTEQARERAASRLEMLGGKESMFVMSKNMGGSFSTKGAMIGSTIEYLVLSELAQMEAYSLLFSRAGEFRTANGTKSVNEGLHHQMLRGKRIYYAKPGAITFDHILEAISYIFKNKNIPIANRKVKFRVGSMAHVNVMQLFRSEVTEQMANMPGFVYGTEATTANKLLTGPLDALHLNSIQFRSVQIPGVGMLEVELDTSLDYQPFSDRFSQGFYGGAGMAHTSYSMVIEDVTNPEYSNVNSKVNGAKLVEGGATNANIYYVKPDSPNVVYGYEQGRMVDNGQAQNVRSSLKQMARTCWATSHSAALMLDTTRYVSIELQYKG